MTWRCLYYIHDLNDGLQVIKLSRSKSHRHRYSNNDDNRHNYCLFSASLFVASDPLNDMRFIALSAFCSWGMASLEKLRCICWGHTDRKWCGWGLHPDPSYKGHVFFLHGPLNRLLCKLLSEWLTKGVPHQSWCSCNKLEDSAIPPTLHSPKWVFFFELHLTIMSPFGEKSHITLGIARECSLKSDIKRSKEPYSLKKGRKASLHARGPER